MSNDHISVLKNDNRLITPVEMLRQLVDEIEAGETICKKAFVVMVDGRGEKISIRFRMANMKCSLGIKAAECFKSKLRAFMK